VVIRGELDVLAITEDAVTAIDSIVSSSGLPDGAGLRITQEQNTEAEGETRTDLRLSLVESAAEGDEVLEDAQIFLEPEAAEFLDNKLLDADIEGDEVRFSLDIQAESR
jgi:iron-sulfur cluster assembly protein